MDPLTKAAHMLLIFGAIGEITFQVLTKQQTFKHLGLLFNYVKTLNISPLINSLRRVHRSQAFSTFFFSFGGKIF
jgi:hypothetical protein